MHYTLYTITCGIYVHYFVNYYTLYMCIICDIIFTTTKQKAVGTLPTYRRHQTKKIERQRDYTMRKTNSKEVKAAVRKYLLECDEITIVEMKEKFLKEYGHEIKRYGQLNACINWLRGLAINVDFYYCDIVKRLAEWLDDTEENQWKYIDSQGDDLYWLLIAREIVASK